MRTKLLSLVALLIVAVSAVSVYAVSSGILTIDSNAESLQLLSKSIQDQPSCPSCPSNVITLELKNTGSTSVTLVKYVVTAGSNSDPESYYAPKPVLNPGTIENMTIMETSGSGDGSYTVNFTTTRGHVFSWDFALSNCSNGGCTIS